MTDPATALNRIDHIVVLMLENRSFDHMLGYLSLEGGRSDIDGLSADMANHAHGKDYPVHRLKATKVPDEHWDPDHSARATDEQINGGAMDGFAKCYAETLAGRNIAHPDPSVVMGYFGAEQVPVYDHLAAEFCVCDAWHSSVPGATWPNRLYAVAGSADGSRDDKPHPPPLYAKKSFIRHLDAAGVPWRWYSYDIGTLRCVDRRYLLGHHDHFRFVDRIKLSIESELEEFAFIDQDGSSFLEDAAAGRLPAFSWVDPNFKDLNLVGSPPNDDHPPSDVWHGQELVFLIYNALAAGPAWDKTLLLVLYDEHGGFFDHVPPPENPPDDDPQTFNRYGIRVPALVVSPWVEQKSVGHTLFDHATIAKTVLTRFCPAELEKQHGLRQLIHWLDDGHPHYMGKRVAGAADIGDLLTRDTPRAPPDRGKLIDQVAKHHSERIKAVMTQGPRRGAGERYLTDLQRNMLAASREIHARGQPAGQP